MPEPAIAQDTAVAPRKNTERPLRDLLLLGSILAAYFVINGLLAGMMQQNPARVIAPFLMFLGNGALFLMTYCWLDTRKGMERLTLRRMPIAALGVLGLCFLIPWVAPHKVSLTGYLLILLVPLSEELYFRGILLDHLVVNTSRTAAVVLTSVLFAVLHLPQGTFLPMLVLGFVLALVTVKSNKVAWAILLHAAWNFAVVWRGEW